MNTARSVAVALLVGATLTGCGGASLPEPQPPVTLTAVRTADGTPVKRLALVDHAVDRLGITTGVVHEGTTNVAGLVGPHKVIPYAAVVYDSDGSAWTYVNDSPGSYVRARITVASIQGDTAVLTAGPADGTLVVTQGAAELLGAEAQISGEE